LVLSNLERLCLQMIDNISAEGVFINLVSSIINDNKPSVLPEGITADDIFAIGSRQDMVPIVFCALNAISPKPESAKWGEYRKRFLDDCMRSEVQMSEYKQLVEYLCGNGVKILPLKGCVIKELYPFPNFRVMSDVDLLYEGVTPKELAGLMEKAGYSTEELEIGYNEIFYKKPCMNIELHRVLVSDDSTYKAVLDNMFEKASQDDKLENLYHMKPEDLYIHVIAHAAKHLKGSGLGIRPVLDLYVLYKRFSEEWNSEYIKAQLASVRLDKFEKKMRDVALAFFGEEEKAVSNEELMVFFSGGTYGKYSERLKWTAIAGGRNNSISILRRIFMPLNEIREWFPILKKHPYLYPLVSVYRWIDRLIHRTSRVRQIMLLNSIPQEEVDNIKKIMEDFGLD